MKRALIAAFSLAGVSLASHSLMIKPAVAGACAGAGLAGWSVWLLWPWRGASQFNSAMKRLAVGFFLRLILVAAIAAWGFATHLAAGLAGIVAFGLTFLILTWVEHSRKFSR